MVKKTKKNSTPDNHFDVLERTTPAVCQLKHMAVDKEFENIKENAERRHEEIKSMIDGLQKNIKQNIKVSNANLKDKIILTEKTIGDKIDSLSEFDDTLKGNGAPGVWESIRSLNKIIKCLGIILCAIVILELGGSWNKIDWKSLRIKIWGPPQTKQIEPDKSVKEAKFFAMPEG